MCFKVRFFVRLHLGFLFPLVAPSHARYAPSPPSLCILDLSWTDKKECASGQRHALLCSHPMPVGNWGNGHSPPFWGIFHTRSTLSPTLDMRAKICNPLITSILKYFFRVWHAACIMLSEHSSQTVTQFTKQQSTIIKQLKNNDYEKDVFRSSSCICDGFSEQRFR